LITERKTQAEAETAWLGHGLDFLDSVAAFDPRAEAQAVTLEYGEPIWDATQVVSANW
jgi:hypothetical protein